MFWGWETADFLQATQVLVSILEILVTVYVAIWIVQSVQKKLDSEKSLNDFFSAEVIQLRNDLRLFLDSIIRGELKASQIKRKHYLLHVRIKDLLSVLNEKYNLSTKILSAYQQNLMKIIEADENYEENFSKNKLVKLNENTVNKLLSLRSDNNHLFNEILLGIYDTNEEHH